jgi:hypothetical protein
LKTEQVVFPDDHCPSGGRIDRSVPWKPNHIPRKLGGRDPGSIRGWDVAIVLGHGVCDTDPCRGHHISPKRDVSSPQLLGDVPAGEVRNRNDVVKADCGL